MKASLIVPCAFALFALSACADEDVATIATEHPIPSKDASPDSGTSNETGTGGDAAASDGTSGNDGALGEGSPDGSQTEAGRDAEAGSAGDGGDSSSPDAGRRDGGPGGDGGLVIMTDAAAADASFQLKNPSGTNLLSFSDIHADCNAVTGSPAGTFVMTCQEKSGTSFAPYLSAAAGPCRTVTVTFATNPTTGPTTGLTLAVVAKTAPAQGEAFVVYQESIDCTPANTNGWSVSQTGGTLRVDSRGDTGMNFTLTNVPLAPSSSAGVVNQNAAGTFTLSGTGFSRLPFGIK